MGHLSCAVDCLISLNKQKRGKKSQIKTVITYRARPELQPRRRRARLLPRGAARRPGWPPTPRSPAAQTPLMLSAMHGKIKCVLRLLQAGANILMFDSVHARTCLHHAAYYGHADCLQAILSIAQTAPVADSWGFARFVNVRDEHGATPLHLAARQGRPECVHLLLENGAIVSAPTGSYGFPGSTSLHLAARGGNFDCVRELLAWGADRLRRDSAG